MSESGLTREEQYARELLRGAVEEAMGAFVKRDVDGDGVEDTLCNEALWAIAETMGYSLFKRKKMSANQICGHVRETTAFWKPVDASMAQDLARRGVLVVASAFGEKHGHVASVHPDGGMVYSGKWGVEVPTVGNVGEKNGSMGANYAFTGKEPPLYHAFAS